MRKNLGFDLQKLIFEVFIAEKKVRCKFPLTRELLNEKSKEELVNTILALTSIIVAERRSKNGGN